MSQDNLIKLACVDCKKVNYYTFKNKKTLKQRLELKKYCKSSQHHTTHKETK